MELVLFLGLWVIVGIYIRKSFLHYKLLRLIQDGGLNSDEDYFLSFLMNNRHLSLKIESIQLNYIDEKFEEDSLNRLKNKINSTFKILLYSIATVGILTLGIVIINYLL